MRHFALDLRHGLRLLASQPRFTLAALLTLALGIASTTTVFSWVDSVLLHPYPGIDATDRLAALEFSIPGAPNGASRLSFLDYRDFRDNLKLVSGVVAHRDEVFSTGPLGDGRPVWGEAVSVNYFEALGVRPGLGRAFTAKECGDVPGACPLAVVSQRFWRDQLRADAGIVGKSLRVNRREFTIAGVAPPEFQGTVTGLRYDPWIPLTMSTELGLGKGTLTERGARGLDILVRLQPGVTIAQARGEAAALSARLAAAYPATNRNVTAAVVHLGEMRSGAAALLRAPLGILFAASIVVLLIACANLANLLLSRSVSRARELNLRMALGAGRARLAFQLTAEPLPLAVAGVPLACWMGDLLPQLVPRIGVPVAIGFAMKPHVALFTVLACVGAALLSSAGPVLVALRADVNGALKEGGRSGAQGRQPNRARSVLAISQVALASLSLVSAGLFLRSFEDVRGINAGFDQENVLLTRFYVSGSLYTPQQMHGFFERLRERLRNLPGVLSASYGDYAPLGSNAGPYTAVQVGGYAPAPEESMMVSESLVAPGYLDTLGIALLEGRDFNARDISGSPPVLIVSQAFARKYFGGASALNRRVRAWGQGRTIVGIAGDSKHFHLTEPDLPYFYSPLAYSSNSSISVYFLTQTAGDPRTAIPWLRREALDLDPDSMAMQPMPLKEWTGVTLFPHRLAATLIAAMGLVSLLLAAAGLYSTMSYSVTQRTHEFGVRLALGASMREVLTGVLRRGLAQTAAGLLVGLAGALILVRLVQGLLVRVSPADPLAFGGAAVFVVLMAIVACAVPAWQAARVDPMVALRGE